MSENKVLGLVPKTETEKDNYRKSMLDVIDNYRTMIENGSVEEFVISSMDVSGEVVITVCCKDMVGGVGLFEIGKNILISQ